MNAWHCRAAAVVLLGALISPALALAHKDEAAAERKAAAAVFTAYNKMLDSHFAVDITATDDQGAKSKVYAEYEGLSRIRVKTDEMEVITTPEGTWVRSNDEHWTRPPEEMAGMIKQFQPMSAAELQASTHHVKDEGATQWQGQPVHAYSYDVDSRILGVRVESHNKVLINAAGLIVHSESDGKALGRSSHTAQDIRYGNDIKVVVPKG